MMIVRILTISNSYQGLSQRYNDYEYDRHHHRHLVYNINGNNDSDDDDDSADDNDDYVEAGKWPVEQRNFQHNLWEIVKICKL